MSRQLHFSGFLFAALSLFAAAPATSGCSATPSGDTGGSGGTTTTSSSSSSTGGVGGLGTGGGMGGTGGDEACTSTSAEASHVQLDIVFLIDRSQSMSGDKWIGTTEALTTFWNDPKSNKIGAGIVYFPNDFEEPCVPEDYQVLNVPIAPLPANAFLLINSMPADATGGSTPTYGALKGALRAATAYQDTHPTHKVILVAATDGGPNSCGATTIDDIADLAKSARNYNGVHTYVIGVEGSDIPSLDKIAAAGGTQKTYDITNDITDFSAKMEEIRGVALGCEFEIPPAPNGDEIDPTKVNFQYTPEGKGTPKVILRADDAADCGGLPGWYFDNNTSPTKIILCPASCATVQADADAKVDVLFGCKSQIN